MKINLLQTLRSLALIPALALGVVMVPAAAMAESDANCDNQSITISEGVDCTKSAEQRGTLFGTGGIFQTITNVLLFIVGAVSVIMLIIGGIRYTVSGGDSTAVTAAKNTILYAIIGIIVSLLAFALVNFVVNSFVAI